MILVLSVIENTDLIQELNLMGTLKKGAIWQIIRFLVIILKFTKLLSLGVKATFRIWIIHQHVFSKKSEHLKGRFEEAYPPVSNIGLNVYLGRSTST